MDLILSGVRFKTFLVYLDYMLISSRKLEDHIKHVDEVLTLLKNAGVSLKLCKCQFFRKRLKYLAHVPLPGLIAIVKDATYSIADVKFPKNLTQLRSFLGAYNIYRGFIKYFSTLSRRLNRW